ncbi:unnamed protein product [Merluccius merluccius]
MESGDSQNTVTRTTRRSTRQSAAKVTKIEARAPLKRTKRGIENTTVVAAVNGSKETKNASADKRSPNKKRRVEKDEVMDGGDDDDMDVEPEEHLEMQKPQDREMDSLHASQQPELFIAEPPRSVRVSSAKSAHPLGSQEDRPHIQRTMSRSIADYPKTMARETGNPQFRVAVLYRVPKSMNYVPGGYSMSANLTAGGKKLTKKVKPGEFLAKWSDLQSQFPGQRIELWKRSKVHLERHLRTPEPTEPVSLILAAGRSAEKTLYCLAQGLASAFSAAHNASVLRIDGAATAGQDSNQVKMDIDNKLRGAFGGGDQPAAVIHRFEELPPGSTLIFYRYCDHENAAYKQVFLAFTVLLPQDHLDSQQSLKEVEEIVQEYIADRFVGSGSRPAFNQMDADKLSGLWSRISHLILPVAEEPQVELNGC